MHLGLRRADHMRHGENRYTKKLHQPVTAESDQCQADSGRSGSADPPDLPRSQIGELLDSMADKGLVAITQSPTTKGARWKITAKGIAALRA